METKRPQGDSFDYIDIDAIDNKTHKIRASKHLLVKNAPSRASRKVQAGSVLFSFVRPYLENIAYVEEIFSDCIASTGFYVCNSNGSLVPEFMFTLMTSEYVINGLNHYMKGDNSPSIRKEEIENFLYPIPPISEQHRIAKKISETDTIIENIVKSEASIKNNTYSAKQKVLELAMSGKLVPQDPNDEPASVLLERILAEKAELAKLGKTRNRRTNHVIFKGDDNSYYYHRDNGAVTSDEKIDLPENWAPCTISDISYVISSTTHQVQSNEIDSMGKYPVISQGQEYIDGFCSSEEKVINDLPVIIFGDHTRVVKYIDFPFVIGADGAKIHKIILANEKFIFYWMQYAANNISSLGYARHHSLLKKSCLLLPPIEEQERIVEMIEIFFDKLDEIAKQAN